MAVINVNSDFVDAIKKQKSIRTQNYRGSLLHTSIHTHDLNVVGASDWEKADVNSILYFCHIPFSASIKEITLATDTAQNELAFRVGIAGINKDGTFTSIRDDLIARNAEETSALVKKTVWPADLNCITLFELLHDDNGLPIEAFKPYVNDREGVLFFKLTAKEATTTPRNSYIEVEFVEASPSASSLLSAIVPDSFPHRQV